MAMYSFGTGGSRQSGNNPFGSLGCLFFAALIIGTVYFFFKMLYIWWVGPSLLALALLINWKVVAGLGKSLLALFKRDILLGLVFGAMCVFGFPIIALLLVFAALAGKRVEAFQKEFGAGMNFPGGDQNIFGNPTVLGDQASLGKPKSTNEEGEYVDFEEIETKPKPQKKTKDVD
jgi:hypothetical protein